MEGESRSLASLGTSPVTGDCEGGAGAAAAIPKPSASSESLTVLQQDCNNTETRADTGRARRRLAQAPGSDGLPYDPAERKAWRRRPIRFSL